ncbi:MAG: FkbM family methyltransferase [Bradymonadia bacterium]|jgi:FkbM family methyltransferase
MRIRYEVNRLLRKVGYDISKFTPSSHPLARRKQLLRAYEIDTVLDIGANSGQYARQLRDDVGFAHRILSFEPLSQAFELLEANAKNDSAWELFQCALGDVEERREINVAGNSYSSSLLDMLPAHLKSAPESHYVGTEAIDVTTLDSLFERVCGTSKNIYMKIDTQGFESKVLKGAEKSLQRIDTVQMEMSLVPLYDGELLFNEMFALMTSKGYTLIAIENGFSDPASGQLLQLDGIFHRCRG